MFTNSNFKNGQNPLSDADAQMLLEQHEVVKEFFRRDGSAEIVNSLNTLIETFLFTANMTSEMRMHIANNMRLVSLITKLGETTVKGRRDGIA